MEPVHVTRKKRDREDLKQQILDAALNIAVNDGWEAVTIRKIAEAVSYTTTIVYGHFENKDALLQEISDNGFKLLYALFQKSVKIGDDPTAQLLGLSLIFWDFASENKELYKLMFSLKHPSFESVKEAMMVVENIFKTLTGRTGNELENLILNWICLRQGCIGTLLNVESGNNKMLEGQPTKDLYIGFMNRFINTISC